MRFGTLKKFCDQFSSKSYGSISELFDAESGISFEFPACEEADFEPLMQALRRVLPHLSAIVGSPVSVLKSRLVLQRAETASSLSPSGIRATLGDMRVWTYRNGELRPESVYVSENTDDPNIYENRLVKALIDRALRFLTLCISYSKGTVRTVRSLKSGSGALGRVDLIRIIGDKLNDPTVIGGGVEYAYCVALRKKFLRLRESEFYRIMCGFPDFEDAEPRDTDIFALNHDYGECFDAWRHISRFESAMSGMSGAERSNVYTAFVSFALIRAYKKIGFGIVRNVYYKDLYKNFSFDGLMLSDGTFNVIMSAVKGEVRIIVQCPSENVQQKLVIGVYAGVADQPRSEDYLSVGFFDAGYGDRFICVRPENGDSAEDLAAAAKLTVLTFGKNSDVYKAICPVCGSTSVTEGEYCTECSDCGAKYRPLKDGRTWINFFESYDPSYERLSRSKQSG